MSELAEWKPDFQVFPAVPLATKFPTLDADGTASPIATGKARRTAHARPRTAQPGPAPSALDLLTQLLQYDPARRIAARDALQHRYFTSAQPASLLPEAPPP